MFLPGGGFVPSKFQKRLQYDPEGRLREYNVSRSSTGGVAVANSLYATDAERFDSIAPFLAANMEKDRPRRNYVILPGGSALYFGDKPAPADLYGKNIVEQEPIPDPRNFFGHDRDPSSLDVAHRVDFKR